VVDSKKLTKFVTVLANDLNDETPIVGITRSLRMTKIPFGFRSNLFYAWVRLSWIQVHLHRN